MKRFSMLCAMGVAMASAGATPFAEPHPLHTSLTVVTVDRGGQVDVSMRAFLDDYTAATEAHARGAANAGAMIAYARSRFALQDDRGNAVSVEGCGTRVESDLVWLCLRGTVRPGAKLRGRNTVLFERFDDQVNIVQVVRGGRRSSVLFTRGDQIKAL